ncbi:transferrin-binding protein-like solute binding protein [Gallibacterium salpingitidis]|uniref:Slam-dependent surface lipoprotein n=1 Tax=Gallibacterium salpingitidis TaxID=505341 RepID=UPI00266FA698|nr:Slam-dependent surface lipoprotein [Gallibacterium salpingitidis]WKT00556.1 transferrin-binding protein-like solute binding protein [Gallibacterium salpingitidis]
MKKSILATVILAAFSVAATAQAAVVTSGISNDRVALQLPAKGSTKHNGWFHQDKGGLPGVKVEGVTKKVTSFQSLTNITKNTQWLKVFGGVDKNGVVVLKMGNLPSWVPGFHDKLGNFAFKKVGAEELYFGEWLAKGGDINKDRVVYYAGNNKTEVMPTGGTAVYDVVGINNNSELDNVVLKGQMTADFNKGKLNGSISKSGLTVKVEDAKINFDASFTGNAVANGNIKGMTNGHFFGKDAAALAGYAKFNGNNQYDTAFGGTKK